MPPSAPRSSDRRLAAIMFTDMVGFSALTQRNEARGLQLLEEQRTLVRELIAQHGGREVETVGDAFLVEFASALEAVRSAIAIQNALEKRNAALAPQDALLLRIGIHFGDVMHRGQEVSGDAVNIAARLEPLAAPGGICVTAQVQASVADKLGYAFESLGKPKLKNIASSIEVFRIAGMGSSADSVAQVRSPLPADRVAVLPFANISPDPGDDYFADGMTEELISAVSKIRGLHVIARTSVMRYKGAHKAVSEIGRELNVGNVLEGSVRKSGDQIRISVQLIQSFEEEPRWSQNYDRQIQDVFAIQSEIASSVAESLRAHVLGPATRSQSKAVNPDAYIAYLRGRQLWNKRTEPDLRKSIEFFDAALRIDPRYAQACAGAADSYAALALLEIVAPREAYPKAHEYVSKALTLDPHLAEAHTSLGLIKFQFDWDWLGAEREFRQAIEINPNYAPAHHFFADYFKAMGRFEEALAEINKARELDPLSLAINTGVGHVLYLSRQFDRAIEEYKRAVELDPTFMATHLWFGRPYLEKGMFAEAIDELQWAVKLSGESTLALGMLGHGLASAGRHEEANAILEKLKSRSQSQYVPSYWIAVIYNGFRDHDQVIAWLRKAFDERSSWLVWCNVEPRFAWLRADPDFEALIEAMRIPAVVGGDKLARRQ